MNSLVGACLVVILALASARPNEFYDTKYDDFNAQDLVDNARLLKSYGNCFLGKGPCTPEGTDFKRIIPEALRSNCGKCSPKQKELVRVVIRGFKDKQPDVWNQLVAKNDPEHEFQESFDKFLNGH